MARATPAAIDVPFARDVADLRHCVHSGCAEEGLYRAPVSRSRLRDYYWFCLEHVRAYNLSWDFFKGMSAAEIEVQRRHDTVWQRPSWPLGGALRNGRGAYRVRDDFGLFGEAGEARPRNGKDRAEARQRNEEDRALAILDLAPPLDFTQIKARYKQLAKQLHPDANGGDKQAEERLKVVNQAYSTLKSSYAT